MPSGKVHDRITIATAVAALPAWWLAAPAVDLADYSVAALACLFSGLWLSGDLDTNSLAYKRWGALRFLWWPYRKLVPHRSWVSHGIAVGPLVRTLYFAVMFWALARGVLWLVGKYLVPVNRDQILGSAAHAFLSWIAHHHALAYWALGGLIVGGLVHSLADSLVSGAKRLW